MPVITLSTHSSATAGVSNYMISHLLSSLIGLGDYTMKLDKTWYSVYLRHDTQKSAECHQCTMSIATEMKLHLCFKKNNPLDFWS